VNSGAPEVKAVPAARVEIRSLTFEYSAVYTGGSMNGDIIVSVAVIRQQVVKLLALIFSAFYK
jgi:hypothetical protein